MRARGRVHSGAHGQRGGIAARDRPAHVRAWPLAQRPRQLHPFPRLGSAVSTWLGRRHGSATGAYSRTWRFPAIRPGVLKMRLFAHVAVPCHHIKSDRSRATKTGQITSQPQELHAWLVKPRVLVQTWCDLSDWGARHSVPRRGSGRPRAGLPKGQGLWGDLAISTDGRGCVRSR
jgi:hypothetical protein